MDARPFPSPDVRGDGGTRVSRGTDNLASADASAQSAASTVNSEPLGRPNRLLHRANASVNSGLGVDVPTVAARTVWKRSDSGLEHASKDEPGKQEQQAPVRSGLYWRFKGAASSGSAVKSDVQPQASMPNISRESEMLPPKIVQEALIPDAASMGATKRMSNGEAKLPIGPHPSTIRVSQPYISQAAIEKKLSLPTTDVQEKSQAEAREDSLRLQGVSWLDNTRRALQLPIRTFTTACVYYHKFRLAHPGVDYVWADAAAASLLQSCKVEDTLKKSKDVLAAAWNLKASGHEQLGADDPMFEAPSRAVIGLERLVLESGGFDFRSRYPHIVLAKVCKSLPASAENEKVAKVAWTILTDLHRTFAPLKQTSATLAIACLELSAHLRAAASGVSGVLENVQTLDIQTWSTTREEIMETLLDALDLYTHHTTSTILGTKYSLEDFLRIRLALNKECSQSNLPRYTTAPEPIADRLTTGSATLRVANGHPTPVSPPPGGVQPQTTNGPPPAPDGGGTLRFILNPQLAADEKAAVHKYFVEEWEEYEEEIEVPLPRPRSQEHERDRRPDDVRSDRGSDRGSERRHPGPPPPRGHDKGGREYDRSHPLDDRRPPRGDPRERVPERERDRVRDRDREVERERARQRERERERRYDDRGRYEERERYDRRERFDRRYDDDRRRREDRR